MSKPISKVPMTDEEWFAQLSGSAASGSPLFPMPDDRIQVGSVGKSGAEALRDAFMFWRFCREMLIQHGNGLRRASQVMDFGCAWGRIIRFWLRDIEPQNLHGFDVEERFLSLARAHVPGPDYRIGKPRPPLDIADNSLDLIYAFSVFSHLPRDVADAWIAEFARILKPGGIACLTTRPRAHIEAEWNKGDHADLYANTITDKATALALYDAGEFVFYPAHGGGGLEAATYGEAIIPPAYARSHWTSLDFIDFAQGYSETYLQPCFVMRKP